MRRATKRAIDGALITRDVDRRFLASADALNRLATVERHVLEPLGPQTPRGRATSGRGLRGGGEAVAGSHGAEQPHLVGMLAVRVRLNGVGPADERASMVQRIRAERALSDQRGRELAEMTDEEALAAADALLEVAALAPFGSGRISYSGLVEQQALFHRRRSRWIDCSRRCAENADVLSEHAGGLSDRRSSSTVCGNAAPRAFRHCRSICESSGGVTSP